MTTLVAALGLTLGLLAAVIWSGVAGRRSLHYSLVVATLASLAWAIKVAGLVGRDLVFEGTAATVKHAHFVAVTTTFLVLPALVVTGWRLAVLDDPRRRRSHRTLAWIFVVLILVTAALGGTMTYLAWP